MDEHGAALVCLVFGLLFGLLRRNRRRPVDPGIDRDHPEMLAAHTHSESQRDRRRGHEVPSGSSARKGMEVQVLFRA